MGARLPHCATATSRCYAAARFLATIAWQMLGVGVGWQVYALTRDPLALGLVGLAQFLPFVTLVLPAGQRRGPRRPAPRADRRLRCSRRCAAAALLAFSRERQHAHLAGLRRDGAASAADAPSGCRPARRSRRAWCPPALFPSAVAINSTLFQTAVIGGPALGGLLYLAGPQVVYGTALALLLCVGRADRDGAAEAVRAATHARAEPRRAAARACASCWRRRTLLGAISLDLFAVLFGGATALLPMVASDVLHVGPVGPRHPAHRAGRRAPRSPRAR